MTWERNDVYVTRDVTTDHKLDMFNLKISLGAVCVPYNDPENIICTISTHTATGSCMRRSDIGAVCGGRVRIEL